MKIRDLFDGKRSGGGKESVEKVEPADMIWVKNRGGLWWPGQVVDENCVSESLKPGKRSAGKVLVRLYGTYTYSYADPSKWRSEFDKVLEQNCSYWEIFRQSLEHDVARIRANESKRQRSKSKATKEDLDPKKKKPSINQSAKRSDESDGDVFKKRKLNHGSSPETMSCSKSRELSARRIRVMQSLGLVAPPGSPFCRSSHVNVNP